MRKSVTILGSTGSVGLNTLDVIRSHAGRFQVAGLAAGSKTDLLFEQIREFSPKAIYLRDESAASALSKKIGRRVRLFTARDGMNRFSSFLNSDILVAATSGTSALLSVLEALRSGRKVALANKEVLVIAGALVMAELRKNPRASLIPVDSEHNAIFQCLRGHAVGSVSRLLLTGSGGPLKDVPKKHFARLSRKTVTNHPKWKMGKKISVDSATLMNKGLELIEAAWLFGLPVERIEVLIHPEAVIHSMVEYADGAVLAQLGVTDMRLPIQYALSFPDRLASPGMRIDWPSLKTLSFSMPDRGKFPCLDIAYAAARQSGSAPCVLSAADETVVGAYLDGKVPFTRIPTVIEKVLSCHRRAPNPDLEEIRSIHDWAVQETKKLCGINRRDS
ncbi:MAG: 1-deoxy-D-xylulose-5-phosphate reductoisomerase [Candidatus Omnitrophica bacterium]|nr:1-deoxy-D-xylulose-5-phosphate reductoisomerase [Candidatus Omnitrophota bacterium]